MMNLVIGSEALASGAVTRHELSRWYHRLYPDVYAPNGQQASLRDRTVGAWLWSRRRGVVAGVAASALHGARWVDADTAIELIWHNGRPPPGITVCKDAVADDELSWACKLPVTTPARTAFDLARRLPRGPALARLDALMHATPFSVEDVAMLAKLRLLLIDAGFPIPTTQIPVQQGWRLVAMLDMGWEEFKVAAEYDGDQHRTLRREYVRDHWRQHTLPRLGWINIKVIAEDREDDVIDRVYGALKSRGWRGTPRYPAKVRPRR
ncbi:hypothetical protein ACAG26_26395 [Mycobacterium sp. pUA109]|uniref:hypothetical protein n=1 Tax=Mycobacterium sp. pUA109 TaxID=3238982 RepID=UPI00351B5648